MIGNVRVKVESALGSLRHAWTVGKLNDHDRGLVEQAIKNLEVVLNGDRSWFYPAIEDRLSFSLASIEISKASVFGEDFVAVYRSYLGIDEHSVHGLTLTDALDGLNERLSHWPD